MTIDIQTHGIALGTENYDARLSLLRFNAGSVDVVADARRPKCVAVKVTSFDWEMIGPLQDPDGTGRGLKMRIIRFSGRPLSDA